MKQVLTAVGPLLLFTLATSLHAGPQTAAARSSSTGQGQQAQPVTLNGPGLSTAALPAGPNAAGQTIDMTVLGSGLSDGMYVTVNGGPGLPAGRLDLQILNPSRAYATVTLTSPLDLSPAATYRVHLFDSSNKPLSSVSLDLEYFAQYQTAQSLPSTEANAKGDSRWGAWAKSRQAKRIDRQTAADQKLLAAKIKAEAVRRAMYLADHPDIQAQSENPFSVPSDNSSTVSVPDSYCKLDSTAEYQYIRVRRSVLDPKEASDSYGRRLGRRFVVFQITVENSNPSLQYILHDVSVDLSRMHHLPQGTERWAFSGQDLIMLRGVPEKGADYDPRNLGLHLIQGTGAVAGGVAGLTADSIESLYSGTTAAFNGPFLTSLLGLFPDHTATQLNRLSDSAFTANTVVAKQSARTFAIFVPEGLFMTHAEQSEYWKEPISVFGNPALDFRQADFCVDGAFISEVPAITLTAASYEDASSVKAGAEVKIDLTGTNLSPTDTLIDIFQTSSPLTSVAANGATAVATVKVPASWTPQDESVAVESKSTGQKTPAITLVAPGSLFPAIKSVQYGTPNPSADPALTVTISGSNLDQIAGVTLQDSASTPNSIDGTIAPQNVNAATTSISVIFSKADFAKLTAGKASLRYSSKADPATATPFPSGSDPGVNIP